ncbi:MAG: FecR domain-containing protein [Deltaproteobacteria bacterium]
MKTWCSWRMICIAAFAALASAGCRCTSSDVIARLEQTQGTVERDEDTGSRDYRAATVGTAFRTGDALKTGHSASAVLGLDDGSRVSLQQDTLLTLSAAAAGSQGQGLEVETGTAVLEVGARALRLYTSFGLAVLDSGTRLQIVASPGGTAFVVAIGAAHFETRDGVRDVAAGETISIAVGGAVIERSATAAIAQPTAPAQTLLEAEPEPTLSIFVQGLRARARQTKSNAWRTLTPGAAQLEPGSSLELGEGTTAKLGSPQGAILLDGKGSFVIGAPNAPFIQVTSGQIAVSAAAGQVSFAVPGGIIRVRPESRVELAVGPDHRTTLRVGLGSAEVQTTRARELISAGESAEMSSAGDLRLGGRGPGYRDMLADAGTSFVVHDPHPPTAIAFALDPVCEGASVIERVQATTQRVLASARGETDASLLFPAGASRYRVRCIRAQGVSDEPAAGGLITIVKDSGTGILSRVPPMTRIDTDGRTYTVMYQNLLPKIAARWQSAPKAKSYTLTVQSRLGKRSFSSAQPAYTFAAGQLPEGNHSLQFSADEQVSPATKLTLRFENAAPTARISAPRDSAFSTGSAVTVSGVAVPGWAVSVGGRELALDEQSRFTEPVPCSSEQRALQIRFTHAERGIHYYLRRAAGGGS